MRCARLTPVVTTEPHSAHVLKNAELSQTVRLIVLVIFYSENEQEEKVEPPTVCGGLHGATGLSG